MVRPVVQHVAPLAEAAEVAGRVVGRIVVEVRGAQRDLGEAGRAQLGRLRQPRAPAAPVTPAQQRVVEPTAVRQASEQRAMRAAAALAPPRRALEPHPA